MFFNDDFPVTYIKFIGLFTTKKLLRIDFFVFLQLKTENGTYFVL